MNFYEELARECEMAGISGRIIEVPAHLRPTAEDHAELERAIAAKIHENGNMLAQSKINAIYYSLPIQ